MHMKQQQDRATVRGLLVPLHAGTSGTVREFAITIEKGGDLLVDDSFLRVGGTELLRELAEHLYRVVEISGAVRRNDRGEPVLDVARITLPGQSTLAHGGSGGRRPRLLRSRRFAHHHR